MLKKLRIPVYFYPVAAMLFWGLSFIWSSMLLQHYQPVTIIFIRLIISSAFLFTLIYFLGRNEKVDRKDYKLILLSALFNPFFYFLGENYGLKYSSPTIAAVVIATIPVFAPLVGYLSFREKLTPVNFIGIAVSFAGVILMLVTRDLSLAADIKGILFLFCAVFSALLYSVTLRKLTLKYSAILLVALQNLIGIFLFLPFFLFYEAKLAIAVPITSEIIVSMFLLAILASSLAFVFFAHSVKLLGISKSNIFSNLIPVFTAFFSYLILAELFNIQKITGIALVIFGVYLSERTKKRV
ncbi:MAG: DMT family transporter [Bacteroidales bacterium]|nr:DMT family transporter [Bacteroidales bacterium]